VADKLLVSSILLMLAGFDKVCKISLIPMIVILCREFIVSSMREYLMEKKREDQSSNIPVSSLAKWKTTIQMFAIGFLIVGNGSNNFYWTVNIIGEALLWFAAAITIYSAWSYVKDFMTNADFND